MTKFDNLRIAEKAMIIFFVCLALSGCTVLRTIPLNNKPDLPQKRVILKVHADDSLWTVQNYVLSENDLSARIIRNPLKITTLQVTHIYAAPLSAVKVEGDNLVIPRGNIAKADYYTTDWWLTIGGAAFLASLILTYFPAFIY